MALANRRSIFVFGLLTALLIPAGCRPSSSEEASDSDANGYRCTKCLAKFYTKRSVFLGAARPECKEDGIVEVLGYYCEKDKRLTLTSRNDGRRGSVVCEKCGAPLNAMILPREKDLKA